MATRTVSEALALAVGHLNEGRPEEAAAVCRAILDALPEEPRACGLMGMVAAGRLAYGEAADWFGRAVAGQPLNPSHHANRAAALAGSGDVAGAGRAHAGAFALAPDRIEWGRAAVQAAHDCDDAVAVLARARALILAVPADPDAWRVAASAAERVGAPVVERRRTLERARRLDPTSPGINARLAGLLAEAWDDVAAADALYRHAEAISPGAPHVWFNHALVVSRDGTRGPAALAAARRAAILVPGDGARCALLARHRVAADALEGAVRAARLAVAASPDVAEYAGELTAAAEMACDRRGAADWSRRRGRLSGDRRDGLRAILSGNLIATELGAIRSAAVEWAMVHADPITRAAEPAVTDPDPERVIRVGYLANGLSTLDFTWLPLVEACGPAATPIVYHMRPPADAIADWRYAVAATCRDASGMSPESLAAMIRADAIDVLVDGVGFAQGAPGLMVMAHRAAPVQVHYPVMTTTGMAAVDAVLVNRELIDRVGVDGFRERVEGLSCGLHMEFHVAGSRGLPDLADAPAWEDRAAVGGAVFGTRNALTKLTPELVDAWGRILARVPEAVLSVKALDATPARVAWLTERLARDHCVAPSRVRRMPTSLSWPEHVESYRAIDIHLDTVPYGGVTTTIEALMMGLPVVTVRGDTVLGAYGADFLDHVGLSELAGRDLDDYVEIAVAAACRVADWRGARADLGRRARASTIMNGRLCAPEIEAAYRRLWRDWCATQRRHAAR